MRLAINGRFLTQPLTGVQRYAYEVTRRLPKAEILVPGTPSPDYGQLSQHALILATRVPGPLWDQFAVPLRARQADLLWMPSGSGSAFVRRQVLTVHDLAKLEYPAWYDARYRRWHKAALKAALPRLAGVITVSDFSRRRIIKLLGIDKARVHVTPLGVGAAFRPAPEDAISAAIRRLGVAKPYVLGLSAVSPRKNFQMLFQAFSRLRSDYADLSLVVVGESGLGFAGNGPVVGEVDGVRQLGRVADDLLPALYSGAVAFAYPSLYEGFGLPILEAMACGAPTITSSITAMPEVAGGAALLVNPHSVDELVTAIRRLLSDRELRMEMRLKGIEHAKRYTWETTAEATLEALQQALRV